MDEDEATPTTDALTAAATGLVGVQGVLVIEGVQTGDGRIMAEGAITWVDPPLPLAWLEQQMHGDLLEGGEQVGTINAIQRNGASILWYGAVDTAIDAGAEVVRRMRDNSAPFGNRYGVSIDPDDWAVELVDTTGDESDMIMLMASGAGPLPDFRTTAAVTAAAGEPDPGGEVIMEEAADNLLARYTKLRIRGATLCAIQAIDGAYCELAPSTVTAAADAPEEPCVECAEQAHAGKAPPLVIVASGEVTETVPRRAPSSWFANPGFAVGDNRLVRQPNGKFVCPMTVTDDGRIFGHMAGWFTCHTAYPDTCVPPPRSRTNYAAFNDQPIETADGEMIRVGQITMGCGHAETDRPMGFRSVKAHYDGGPGAVQIADVMVGEDEFGIWYAGAIRDGVTNEQVRSFRSTAVSGDWREVWRGKGLDLVACLAGVPAPGFPIASMAASALIGQGLVDFTPRALYDDGRVVALVAAGSVPQPNPWDRVIAEQANEIADLKHRLGNVERVTNALRPIAASAMVDGLALPALPEPAPVLSPLARRFAAVTVDPVVVTESQGQRIRIEPVAT